MDTDHIRPSQTGRAQKDKELITLLEVPHQDMFGRELRRQGLIYLSQVATEDGSHLKTWTQLATPQQQLQAQPPWYNMLVDTLCTNTESQRLYDHLNPQHATV